MGAQIAGYEFFNFKFSISKAPRPLITGNTVHQHMKIAEMKEEWKKI